MCRLATILLLAAGLVPLVGPEFFAKEPVSPDNTFWP